MSELKAKEINGAISHEEEEPCVKKVTEYRKGGYHRKNQRVYPQSVYDKVKIAYKEEQMSMRELLRIEYFLAHGEQSKLSSVPDNEKARLIEEYPITCRGRRYLGDLDEIWDILTRKFPEAAARYKNYKECKYALKYGAAPCSWEDHNGDV